MIQAMTWRRLPPDPPGFPSPIRNDRGGYVRPAGRRVLPELPKGKGNNLSIKTKMLGLTAAAAVVVASAGAATVTAAPALASTRTAFAVQDVGGVLVTRYPLAVGQEFFCGGVAYTVRTVLGGFGTETITVTPLFPVSDIGRTVSCTT
jgi:hypothetical protein